MGRISNENASALRAGLRVVREKFRVIPVSDEDRLIIGVVGEIFCRLNTFLEQ